MVKSSSEQVGLKKGPWNPEEDQKLMAYIQLHGGHGTWSSLPAEAGLQRSGKSCRMRWINYLKPDIKRGNFNSQEDQTIIQLHALLGNRWSVIARHLPKRTDNEIKNYWNTHHKKRLITMGINPTTHKPLNDNGAAVKDRANLSHVAQWETARLQAEARQVQEYSKLPLHVRLGSSSSQASQTRLVLNKLTPRLSSPPCPDVLKVWQNSWSSTSAVHHTPKMHSMYAMMLATDDLESTSSTLSFRDTCPTNCKCTKSNNTFGLINQSSLPSSTSTTITVTSDMAAVEALRSTGHSNCVSTEDLHEDDLLASGFTENSASPQQNLGVSSVGDDWEAILDLVVNGSPPVFP